MNDAARIHPIERLVGRELPDQWTVIERRNRDPGGSGMSRSVCYIARNNKGELGFVKAFDFREVERSGDIRELQKMSQEYLNERDIHALCSAEGVTRVTRFYSSGTVTIDDTPIHYLLTEYADGCIRDLHPPGEEQVPLCARLRFHREIAAGLQQLHKTHIAHQDLKPSNAVHIGGQRAKIIDMGSASALRLPVAPPHDLERYAGQSNYAPYELLYGESGSFYVRRIGCDIFLLGNLIFTDIVGVSLTSIVLHCIDKQLRHDQFTGPYSDVMPELIEWHEEIIPTAIGDNSSACVADELATLVSALCHPDPRRRGHPRNVMNGGDQYGLERIISTLNMLSMKASLNK